MQSGVLPGIQFGLIECSMTVAPVVVKPDIDSNHELTNPLPISAIVDPSVNGPWNTPPSQNGRLPMRTATGHAKATAANASLSRNLSVVSDLTPILSNAIPIRPENAIGIKNATDAVLIPSNHQVTTKLNDNGMSIATIVHPTIRDKTSRRILFTP